MNEVGFLKNKRYEYIFRIPKRLKNKQTTKLLVFYVNKLEYTEITAIREGDNFFELIFSENVPDIQRQEGHSLASPPAASLGPKFPDGKAAMLPPDRLQGRNSTVCEAGVCDVC